MLMSSPTPVPAVRALCLKIESHEAELRTAEIMILGYGRPPRDCGRLVGDQRIRSYVSRWETAHDAQSRAKLQLVRSSNRKAFRHIHQSLPAWETNHAGSRRGGTHYGRQASTRKI